jgi:hypothetical protein
MEEGKKGRGPRLCPDPVRVFYCVLLSTVVIRTGNRVISPVVVGRKEQQLRLGEPKRSLVLDNTHGHPVGSLEYPK